MPDGRLDMKVRNIDVDTTVKICWVSKQFEWYDLLFLGTSDTTS